MKIFSRKLPHFMRPKMGVFLFSLIVFSVLAEDKAPDWSEQVSLYAKNAVLYIGLGSAGILVAPTVYRGIVRYSGPAWRAGVSTAKWSYRNPKKALWISMLLSGGTYFGAPYVGMLGNVAVAHTVAQTKAWTVWDQEKQQEYIEELKKQLNFVQGLQHELYQVYLAMQRTLPENKTVTNLQRKTAIGKQLEACKKAKIPLLDDRTVKVDDEGRITGNLSKLATISETAKELSLVDGLKSWYQIPLWMEDFSESSEVQAFVAFVGNGLIGDINELFAKVCIVDQQNEKPSLVASINQLLQKSHQNKLAQGEAALLEQITHLFDSLWSKTTSFVVSRQYRLSALKNIKFKEKS